MKRIFQRLLPLLLTAALLAGSVSAGAAYVEATAPGDPNPTHRTLSSDEIRGLYMDSVHVADADDDDHDWPSNGSIYIQVAGKYTLSDLNGVTIPANLLVDVYQVRGSEYRFLVRYDTRNGKPITVTDASADAKNSGTSSSASSSGFSDVAESDYFADAVA